MFRVEVIGGRLEFIRFYEIFEIVWMDVDKVDELMFYYKDGIWSLVEGNEIFYYD